MGDWNKCEYDEIFIDGKRIGKPVSISLSLKSMNKVSNKAPKNIKGDYDLSIHGNKIVLVDNADGTTVEAKRSPEDEFDIGEGIKEVFKKLNVKREEMKKQKEEEDKRIKVGDWVEVVNSGRSNSTGVAFFEQNNVLQYAAKFRYGVCPCEGTTGKVLFVTNEKEYENNIAVVEVPKEKYYGASEFSDLNCYGAIYLVNVKGLRKVAELHV